MPTWECATGWSAKAAGKPMPLWPHGTFSWEYPVITGKSSMDTSSRLAPACFELNERRGHFSRSSCHVGQGSGLGSTFFSFDRTYSCCTWAYASSSELCRRARSLAQLCQSGELDHKFHREKWQWGFLSSVWEMSESKGGCCGPVQEIFFGAVICGQEYLWAVIMILGGCSWVWVSMGRTCFVGAIEQFWRPEDGDLNPKYWWLLKVYIEDYFLYLIREKPTGMYIIKS